ncbi:MAG TPA: lipopolysaccharide heptosyltransferase I [Xanthobacteraceae bacterium]|jgi:heptosyltransferase-1|nr:lipopolysaccharide heptosyltransferase I [Xanthobacteraceae bacterium]
MSDILFIKTSSLGDVIHQMPAVTELRRNRPAARISWVVEQAFAPLVRLNGAVDAVIPVDSRRWRHQLHRAATWREAKDFVAALRARRHDEIIDTQGLIRTALVAKLARGRRHGYDAQSVREPLASLFYDVRHKVDRGLHAIARNRLLSALALGHAVDKVLDFGLDRAALAGKPRAAYAVLLHATARPEKEWPEPSWIEAGSVLSARGVELVLPYGSAREQERARRIAAALPGANVPERAPLDVMARLVAGASFVIGVDTGLLHLAAALGVPLVAIFVGSEPGLTGPMGAGPIAVVGGKSRLPSAGEVVAALQEIRR